MIQKDLDPIRTMAYEGCAWRRFKPVLQIPIRRATQIVQVSRAHFNFRCARIVPLDQSQFDPVRVAIKVLSRMRQASEPKGRPPRIKVPIGPELIHGVGISLINITGRTIECAVITLLLFISYSTWIIIALVAEHNVFDMFLPEK